MAAHHPLSSKERCHTCLAVSGEFEVMAFEIDMIICTGVGTTGALAHDDDVALSAPLARATPQAMVGTAPPNECPARSRWRSSGRLTANAGLPSEKPSRLRRWDAKATNARDAIIDLMQISL